MCLNGILISLLYRTQPKDMQLLLIDPKRIEMAVYADEPHLVHPVVTEMSEAKNALDWAVHEMDRRYEAMARPACARLALTKSWRPAKMICRRIFPTLNHCPISLYTTNWQIS